MKKLKTITDSSIFTASVLFLVLLSLYFVRLRIPEFVTADASTATLVISFDKDKQRTFSGPIMEKMTVLDALLAATYGSDNIKINYYIDPQNNVNLSSINGYISLNGHGWNFYVNSELVNTKDINKIYVKSNDLLKAEYH